MAQSLIDDRGELSLIEDRPGMTPGRPGLTTGQQIVRQSAAPIILGAIGGMLAGGPGVALGAGTGELINQFALPQFTGSRPDPLSFGLAVGGGALAPIGRGIARNLPGSTAGLQEAVKQSLGPTGQKLAAIFGADDETVNFLFNRVRRLGAGVMIETDLLRKTVSTLSQEIQENLFATGPMRTLVSRLSTLIDQPGTMIPMNQFLQNRSGLGVITRHLERKGGTAWGTAKAAYRAMTEQLDESVKKAPPGVKEAYALAVEGRKRLEFSEWMKDFFTSSTVSRLGQRQVDIDGVITRIFKNEDVLRGLLPKGEVDEVLTLLSRWADIGVSAKVAGEGLRGIVAPERVVIGGAAGLAAKEFGMDIAGSVGTGLIGVLGVELIARFTSSPLGRSALKQLALHGFGLDQSANILLQALRSGGLEAIFALPGGSGAVRDEPVRLRPHLPLAPGAISG